MTLKIFTRSWVHIKGQGRIHFRKCTFRASVYWSRLAVEDRVVVCFSFILLFLKIKFMILISGGGQSSVLIAREILAHHVVRQSSVT